MTKVAFHRKLEDIFDDINKKRTLKNISIINLKNFKYLHVKCRNLKFFLNTNLNEDFPEISKAPVTCTTMINSA